MNFNQTDEQIKKLIAPNYVGNGLFINTNPNRGIVETKKLNTFSSHLRNTDFAKSFISQEGFELSPIDFTWEYLINFNRKSGFMVMREYGSDVKLWIYSYNDDLSPEEVILRGFEAKNFNKIITFIKSKRQILK